jgi:hypothetical protein
LQNEAFPTHGTILAITGGSSTDFKSKRQHRDYNREVDHVAVEVQSHKPNGLTSFPHTDAMVVTVHIDKWDVSKILIDNGSQAEIPLLLTFEKMGYNKKKLKEPIKPLYSFGGKRSSP